MQCVILAGGLGLRLRPITETIPKAMVIIENRPFCEYQLDWLSRQSIDEVVFCIGYLGEQIASHLGDGSRWGVTVRYVNEGRELKGTGGALRLAYDNGLLAESFFVLYGDSFLPIEFPPVFEAFRKSGQPALMTVMRNEGRWDTSNVVFSSGAISLYDKRPDDADRQRMSHIDYGLSLLSRDLVRDSIVSGEVTDLATLFRDLSKSGKLAGYEVDQRFYEVGSSAGIADFAEYVRKHKL